MKEDILFIGIVYFTLEWMQAVDSISDSILHESSSHGSSSSDGAELCPLSISRPIAPCIFRSVSINTPEHATIHAKE
jgi:hypothetical protein